MPWTSQPIKVYESIFSLEKPFTKSDFLSLLFYMGYLSYDTSKPFRAFAMPNYVIKQLYLEFFINLLAEKEQLALKEDKVSDAIVKMAFEGNIKPFFNIIQDILTTLSNRDYINFDEKYIKLLIIATSFMADSYYMKSEREVQNGYVDILFFERPPNQVNYQYIFELKYLRKSEEKQLEAVTKEASQQLQNYIQNEPSLAKLENLRAVVLVVVKDQLHIFEEKARF